MGGAWGEAREDWALTLLRGMSLEKGGAGDGGVFRGAELSKDLRDTLRQVCLGGGDPLLTLGERIESPGQVARLVQYPGFFRPRGSSCPLGGHRPRGGAGVPPGRWGDGLPGQHGPGGYEDEALAEAQRDTSWPGSSTPGITWNFAPVVDVNNNPANPIIGIRSFGSSPEDVARLGAALGRPHYAGVLWTAKHYPGHGDTDTDSHLGLPDQRRPGAPGARGLAPFDALIREESPPS